MGCCPHPFLHSSVDPARRPPGGLVPAVWTEFPDRRDPVITQLPAEVPVGDNRDVVDMDITVDICQVNQDVIDSRAMVAMVGLDTVQMGEETPMDCDGDCVEWDIRNKFETVAFYYKEISMIRTVGRLEIMS